MRAKLIVSLALVLATAAAFSEVPSCGFLTYDDDEYVTSNAEVQQGLTLDGVKWAFTTRRASNWHPLTWLSHMLDYELFGLEPAGHHLVSLALHITNVVLLFLLLTRLTGALFRSAFAAGLFALHPLHVESVVWISERKDVLCTLFWILAVWSYASYAERPRPGALAASVGLFALGLMAKSMLVTLPFVLLLFDVWPLRRLRWFETPRWPRLRALVLEKIPFLIVALGASVVAVWTQRGSGTLWSLDLLPLQLRFENAAVSYVRYLGKLLWPADLAIFYPHPIVWPTWQVAGATVLLLGLSVAALRLLRRCPYVTVGWLFFLGTLVPTIGLVQVGNQAMADRYTYLPAIGLFVVVAWGVPDLLAGWRHRRPGLALAAAIVLLACALVSARYVPLWKNTLTIFEHALETTRENATAHNTVGFLLARKGNTEAAVAHFDEALRIAPTYALAHFNKGTTLLSTGEVGAALGHLQRSVELRPGYAPARFELARAFELTGRLEHAVSEYRAGLNLEPGAAGARTSLGIVLAARGEPDAALTELRESLRLWPEQPRALESLAHVLELRGEVEEAVGYYRATLALAPDAQRSLRRLAWIRATHPSAALRDARTALDLAERACAGSAYGDPADLDILAAAYAEAGDFEQASEIARRAALIARARDHLDLARAIDLRLSLYEQGRPFRLPSSRPPSATAGSPP